MQEDIDLILEMAQEGMGESVNHLGTELKKIRAGKASPAVLEGVMVEYYGSPTPLKQVANVSTSDARTLVIQPWEKTMLAPIEKAIFNANLGFTPMNDGEVVRINIPVLTEDRRREYVKRAKGYGEDAKVGIRNHRQEAMKGVKGAVKEGYPEDAGKRAEGQVQDLTDQFSKKVDEMIDAKEKDIMTI